MKPQPLNITAFLVGAALVTNDEKEFQLRYGVTKSEVQSKVRKLESLIKKAESGDPLALGKLRVTFAELEAISKRGMTK